MLRQRRVTPEDTRRKWQNTNEPGHRGARRNRFLRMSRTEPRSRRRLVPRQANRCGKPLRACRGNYIDRRNGESHAPGRDINERVGNNRKH